MADKETRYILRPSSGLKVFFLRRFRSDLLRLGAGLKDRRSEQSVRRRTDPPLAEERTTEPMNTTQTGKHGGA